MLASDIELIYQLEKKTESMPRWTKDERLDYCDKNLVSHKALKNEHPSGNNTPEKEPVFSFPRITASIHSISRIMVILGRKGAVRTIR